MNQQTIPLNDIVNAPRDPNEVNLVLEVNQYLLNAGLIKESELFLNDPSIKLCINKINVFQRYVLNRYFNLQIYNVGLLKNINTIDERYMLISDGEDKEWLSLFRKRVLPFCIEHRIPTFI